MLVCFQKDFPAEEVEKSKLEDLTDKVKKLEVN